MTKQQQTVYLKYHKLVFFIAISMIERHNLPIDIKDDVAQQGFLGMFRALNRGYRVTPQLIRACINNAMRDAIKKERRYRARFHHLEDVFPNGGGDESYIMTDIENLIDAERLLSLLPETQRQILIMNNEGYTDEEIAFAMNLTKSRVAELRTAALTLLRDRLQKKKAAAAGATTAIATTT